ncbi:MAG: hypothetical protein AAGA54_07050 [Myxococcota bacterium]
MLLASLMACSDASQADEAADATQGEGSGGSVDSVADGESGDAAESVAEDSAGDDTDGEPSDPWLPGIQSTLHPDLPGGAPVACEWDWFIGHLFFQRNDAQPDAHSPRRMYSASCDTHTDAPRLYTSLTVGAKVDSGLGGVSGVITVGTLNAQTGAVEVNETYHFPECRSMHGIAASSDCGTVAALCRTANTSTGEDHDAVANGPDPAWMTNENVCGNEDKMNDHMWLYEWPDGDLSAEPIKVIVHKSIGSWEYGSNYLRYAESQDTYGIAVKATVGEKDVGSGCHEADTFLVLDRADYRFFPESERGWVWACATGHTIHNRPAFDPATGKYAMLCSTDWNDEGEADRNEIAFRLEDAPKDVVHYATGGSIRIKGGAGPLVPRDTGGFLGLIVGDPTMTPDPDYASPTQIGLVGFDAEGDPTGEIRWFDNEGQGFHGWPQLGPLGGDRYLLAWGEGYQAGSAESNGERNAALVLPQTFWMMEIDGDGNALTAPAEVTEAGWGETNEMVSLGDGRVAWSFVPNDRRDPETGTYPSCNQDLVHYVYTSASMP